MSNSDQLSKKLMTIGGGKTLTKTANKMDKLIVGCVKQIQIKLQEEYNGKINLYHDTKIYLKDIVAKLRKIYPNEIWFYNFEKSTIKPDGGILYIVDNEGRQYPILIAEQKSQGTNDRIVQETGKKQSKTTHSSCWYCSANEYWYRKAKRNHFQFTKGSILPSKSNWFRWYVKRGVIFMTFAEFMVFLVKMLFAAFALYLLSEVVKTYIKHKYSKEVVEAEKEKKCERQHVVAK